MSESMPDIVERLRLAELGYGFHNALFREARKEIERLRSGGAGVPAGWKLMPVEDTEEMWSGLARQIVMWRDMHRPTGVNLYQHLRSSGREIPDWLPALIPDTEHVPPKGSVCGAIYRAMLAAAPEPPASDVVGKLVEALNERDMFLNPDTLDRAAHEIDCYPGCDRAWHASWCHASERGDYCPNDVAETLRAVARVARDHAALESARQGTEG